jgi:hypothetical protein
MRKNVAQSIYEPNKDRKARKWIRNEESRVARITAWAAIASAIAAVASAITAVATFVYSRH